MFQQSFLTFSFIFLATLATLLASSLAINNNIYNDRVLKYRSLLTGENVILKKPLFRELVDTSCLVDDVHCVLENGNIIDAFFSVMSSVDCQYTCANTVKNCRAFTWFGDLHPIFPNSCFLFTGCSKVRKSEGTVSGPVTCNCSSKSACQGVKGNFVKFMENVGEEDTCRMSCKDSTKCKFYTWFGPDNRIFAGYCFLFSSCDKSSCNCKDCHSGPRSCFDYEVIEDPVTTPEILDDDTQDDNLIGSVDPLFPNLSPSSELIVGSIPDTPGSMPSGDLSGGLVAISASMDGNNKDELMLNLESSAPVDGLETSTSTSDMMQMLENNLDGLSGQLSVLQPGDQVTASIGSLTPDLSEMAGAILALNPDGTSMEKYQSAVVNYMPALKWLLVVMDHQRKLEEEDHTASRYRTPFRQAIHNIIKRH